MAVAQKNLGDLNKLSLGVKFQKADKLFADKQFEEAAAMYVQIVDSDPKNEDADKALNNAAVAYENVKRFAAATKLYERIVNDYPKSKFVDDALFQTFDQLPRQKRRDADIVSTAIEKAVSNAIAGAWGKRPAVHVLVVEV